MQKTPVQIITSADGSNTLYHPEIDETYHSRHGALQESRHVFIEAGLRSFQDCTGMVEVLEVGFGTGLNTLLSIEQAMLHIYPHIRYTSIEPFPIPLEIAMALNYTNYFPPLVAPFFGRIHECAWEEANELIPGFTLQKCLIRLEDFMPASTQQYHLVYYDAFAPGKQAEMWQAENLQKVFTLMKPGGILVTYCAKGQFRRDLRAVGFEVHSLPGPPGKREMTKAVKPATG